MQWVLEIAFGPGACHCLPAHEEHQNACLHMLFAGLSASVMPDYNWVTVYGFVVCYSKQNKQCTQGSQSWHFILAWYRLQVQQESHQQTRNGQTVSNANSLQISVVSEKFEGMSMQERQTLVEQVTYTEVVQFGATALRSLCLAAVCGLCRPWSAQVVPGYRDSRQPCMMA